MRRHRRSAWLVVLAVLAVAFLSVNVFPSINNDGVQFIDYSQSLTQKGFVHLGYRQIGYPLFLGVQRFVSQFAGIEALLFSTLTQRLLLVFGVLYAAWLWRWKATPLLFLVITPSFVAYTDLIMTEALTVPLALILACMVSHHFALVATATQDSEGTLYEWLGKERLAWLTAIAAGSISLALILIRFPLAVFGIVPLAIWIAARRRGASSRVYGTVFLSYLAAAGALTVGMMAENSTELGTATPNARTERASYWVAWQVVFTLHPENQTKAALSSFYDDGNPYIHIWDVEEANPEYVDQAEVLEESSAALLAAAGLDPMRERLMSFLGALRGGRLDELRPRIETILDTDASSVDQAIHVNDVSRNQGRGVFNERYNEGHKPQGVITSPALPSVALPYFSVLLTVLLPLSLIGTVVLALMNRKHLLAAVFLIPVVVSSAVLAWSLADNVRFLMTTSVYAIAGFCALWSVPQPPERRRRVAFDSPHD